MLSNIFLLKPNVPVFQNGTVKVLKWDSRGKPLKPLTALPFRKLFAIKCPRMGQLLIAGNKIVLSVLPEKRLLSIVTGLPFFWHASCLGFGNGNEESA
jgi:hypothetical protein